MNFCFNDLKSVYVIRYGSNLFHSERVSTIRKEKFVNFSWLVYYLEDTQGHKILIDTGIENEFHASLYGISNLVTPSSILKSNQISPNSITDIFITHWHLDHIGGISQYPMANVFVQKLEYNWILKNSDYTFFKNFFLQKEKQKKLFLVEKELQVYEIFFLKWTGGHTVGSLSVLVNVPKMQIVFTGDECYFREECKQKIPLPRSAAYSYSKNKIFLESVQENWLIFTMHDPSIPGATNSNFLRLY
ncbi:MAG: MBL fold metallo-hydrolase [Leptospiraceae bacterium]|nr:MBL fold metallo-hydrolase [Leptospiraceae bacterium]